MPAFVTTLIKINDYAIYDIAIIGRTIYATVPSSNCILQIRPNGEITVFAGNKLKGDRDGMGTVAQFNHPCGIIAVGEDLYVADKYNNRIRKITPDGNVTTVAGSTAGYMDGSATNAHFMHPHDITAIGNTLYVVDTENTLIRKIAQDGTVTTVAGSTLGNMDGMRDNAQFYFPCGITAIGNDLYVADSGNNSIRKITPDGNVTTLAGSSDHDIGTPAIFSYPRGITAIGENLYVADFNLHRIREITPDGKVTTIAGSKYGHQNGIGTDTKFFNPTSVKAIGNTLYVVDATNYSIRIIDLGPTNENRARKKNVLEQLRTFPPVEGMFPGGIEFQEAEERFREAQNIRRGKRSRKYLKKCRKTRKRK